MMSSGVVQQTLPQITLKVTEKNMNEDFQKENTINLDFSGESMYVFLNMS